MVTREWERFTQYARQVRVLILSDFEFTHLVVLTDGMSILLALRGISRKMSMSVQSARFDNMGIYKDSDFEPALIQHLSTLGSLQHLDTELRLPVIPRFTWFGYLRSLTVTTLAQGIERLMDTVSSQRLITLELAVTPEEEAFHQRPICPPVISTFHTILTVKLANYEPRRGSSKIRLMNHLRPLLALPMIQRVNVHIMTTRNLAFTFTNGDTLSLAEAWIRIRHLTLKYTLNADAPTIQSLLYFAELCPNLQFLHLSGLSDTVPFKGEERKSFPTLSQGLQTLEFPPSGFPISLKDHARVAHFLHSIFPSLCVPSTRNHIRISGGKPPHWEKIQQLISELQAARRAPTVHGSGEQELGTGES